MVPCSALSRFKRLIARGFPAAYTLEQLLTEVEQACDQLLAPDGAAANALTGCEQLQLLAGCEQLLTGCEQVLTPWDLLLAPWELLLAPCERSSSQMWEQLARTTGSCRAAQGYEQTSFSLLAPCEQGCEQFAQGVQKKEICSHTLMSSPAAPDCASKGYPKVLK